MSSWFDKLIDRIEIPASGMVADNLRAALKSGEFRVFTNDQGIDVSVSREVVQWFNDLFMDWFESLNVLIDEEQTSLNQFSGKINMAIQSMAVARAYYSKQADTAINSSLKTVALAKVQLIEEVITSLVFAYEQCLKSCGIEPSKTIQMTNATTYQGWQPETYHWMQNKVIANHQKFEEMQETAGENQSECPKPKRDLLPWFFCGVFGLMAWSAAVTKDNKKK